MPSEDRKYTEPTIPGWARRLNAAHDAGKPTILFLDELTTVPPSVAAPLLGIVQSRRADGWTIPADTRIVAAANPPDLAVGGWALDPAMANRWVHIDWPAPVTEWVAWAAEQSSPALRTIAEYIASVPDELLRVPTDIRKRSGAWPSPRSWTNAAALIDASGEHSMAALAVGDGASATFAAWAATRDVPTVQAMLDGAELPERQDAFVTALRALSDAITPDTADRTIEILIGAVATDPAVVAIAARAIATKGHIAGIAPLVAALREHGIELATVRA
jgi:MoxR-like ATPase